MEVTKCQTTGKAVVFITPSGDTVLRCQSLCISSPLAQESSFTACPGSNSEQVLGSIICNLDTGMMLQGWQEIWQEEWS